jgi:hypothetical protein
MTRALDRPGDELREEGDVERVVERFADRLEAAAVDVDGVAHRLERVEGDADRKHDFEREVRQRQPGQRGEVAQALREEAGVLEDAQDREVGDDTEGHPQPAAPRVVRPRDPEAGDVVDRGREQQQATEAPVPRAVEEVARGQQHAILRALRQHDVQGQADREEEPELEAIEEHASGGSIAAPGRPALAPCTLPARREPR